MSGSRDDHASGLYVLQEPVCLLPPARRLPELSGLRWSLPGGGGLCQQGRCRESIRFRYKGGRTAACPDGLGQQKRTEPRTDPGQTFLVDNDNRYWNVVPTHVAVDRLQKSTELASFFGGGRAKGRCWALLEARFSGQLSALFPARMSAEHSVKGRLSAGQGGRLSAVSARGLPAKGSTG